LSESEGASGSSGASYYRNWISFGGAALMLLGFVGSLALILLELMAEQAAPYLGVNYVLFMGMLVVGFVMIPVGVWHERRRHHAAAGQEHVPEIRLDLRIASHRYGAISFLVGLLLVLLLVGVGAYRSFQMCHSVMQPEWTAYHRSAHARVKCVECHIGSGADWFVRSKLSGLRQIWAVAVNSYPRPIPTPIEDLRPARETCEECHWRRKFTGYKESVGEYFLGDEENTAHSLRMLVKIGGERTAFLKGSGIHYHMLIARNIEYIARDERRQEISWLRVTRADGSITEYENEDYPLDPEHDGEFEVRTMDCMDCHNRPAHQFPSPVQSINRALAEERVSPRLPYMKKIAVEALDSDYASSEQAMTGIANTVRSFYLREYPEVLKRHSVELIQSTREVQRIYSETIFPAMKAKWSAYPDNIGHMESDGCFRCHTESMVSDEGNSVYTGCSDCHLILAQGETIEQGTVDFETGLPFEHPEDGEVFEEFELCTDCHTGGADIYE
jgi:hypothetical protein